MVMVNLTTLERQRQLLVKSWAPELKCLRQALEMAENPANQSSSFALNRFQTQAKQLRCNSEFRTLKIFLEDAWECAMNPLHSD